MNNNIPLNSTDLGVRKQMEPNTIEWRKSGKEILTIHADGRITVSEDCKPTETAVEVLRIMRDQWMADVQCAKIRDLQERIKRLESWIESLEVLEQHSGILPEREWFGSEIGYLRKGEAVYKGEAKP